MTSTIRLKALFLISFSLLMAGAKAQDIEQTKKLADHFFAGEQFTEALYYYQRVAFFVRPETDPALLGRIADCFYASGDFNRALEYYDHAYFSTNLDSLRNEFLFNKITTFLEQGNYHSALIELLGMETELQTPADQRKELFLGASYFGLEDFEQAGTHFVNALPDSDTIDRQSLEELFQNPKNFSRPNPKWALALSAIIPGSGQLYAGDPGSAINSFLLTGVFVGLVVYLAVYVHPIEALLTGSPWFQRYYQGGFDHAKQTATDKREQKRNTIYHQTLSIINDAWQ